MKNPKQIGLLFLSLGLVLSVSFAEDALAASKKTQQKKQTTKSKKPSPKPTYTATVSSKTTSNSVINFTATLPSSSRELYVHVVKGNSYDNYKYGYHYSFPNKNKKIEGKLPLPYGSGTYTIVFESEGFSIPDNYTFKITNNDLRKYTEETAYLAPSNDIQSIDPEITSLASRITEGITDDYEKSRAIHDWVTTNIAYDTQAFFSDSYTETDALGVLHTKKSVCQGYSNLTAALHRAVGISTRVVEGVGLGYGYEKGNWANVDKTFPNHAWNEAYINNRWVIIDTTWDAGGVGEDRNFRFSPRTTYFDPDPQEFSKDHLKIRVQKEFQ